MYNVLKNEIHNLIEAKTQKSLVSKLQQDTKNFKKTQTWKDYENISQYINHDKVFERKIYKIGEDVLLKMRINRFDVHSKRTQEIGKSVMEKLYDHLKSELRKAGNVIIEEEDKVIEVQSFES